MFLVALQQQLCPRGAGTHAQCSQLEAERGRATSMSCACASCSICRFQAAIVIVIVQTHCKLGAALC